jgi:hypothetical protein
MSTLLAGLVLCCGCGKAVGPEAAPGGRPSSAATRRTSLEHNFGVVRPGTDHRHGFLLRNETNLPWTFKAFHTSCSCTLVEPASPAIAPGTEETLILLYRAPGQVVDHERHVEVEFEEPGAPTVGLTVRARVRQPMTLIPDRLDLTLATGSRASEGNLEVQNFSGADWPGLDVCSPTPWLRAEAVPIPAASPPAPDAPRQRWRVVVRARPEGLMPARHTGSVAIEAAAGSLSRDLPVALDVTAPVVAIPDRLFLGTLAAGEAASRSMLLKFASAAVAPDPSCVRIEHDLGDSAVLECRPREGAFWVVSDRFRGGHQGAPASILVVPLVKPRVAAGGVDSYSGRVRPRGT